MRIFITGISGVGKTTALAELQARGFAVIDLDATGICRWRERSTKEFVEYGTDGRDSKWLAGHEWHCESSKLGTLLSCIREDKYLFVSGAILTENLEEIMREFDEVFLLTARDEVIKQRITERSNNHFGRKEDEQSFILKQGRRLISKLGNVNKINTERPTEPVVDDILKELNLI